MTYKNRKTAKYLKLSCFLSLNSVPCMSGNKTITDNFRRAKMRLYEKYRPKKLSEIVGQSKAVGKIRQLNKNGMGSRAFWISGLSGTGKTSLARIIAAKIADEFYVTEYDNAIGVEDLEQINMSMNFYGGGKGGRAFIINEAHGLRKWIIQEFLGILERIPEHVVFVFTTTKAGQEGLFEDQIDAGPLLSRCIEITLRTKNLEKTFAKRARQIAIKEHLNGKTLTGYEKLARDCKSNFRTMLQKIEAGEMKK